MKESNRFQFLVCYPVLCWERIAELFVPPVSRSYCRAHTFLLAHMKARFSGCSPRYCQEPTDLNGMMQLLSLKKYQNHKGQSMGAGMVKKIIILLHLPRCSKQRQSLLLSYSTLFWNPIVSQMKQGFATALKTVTHTLNTHIYLLIFLNKI